ncbi:MAG: 50S ribosomal protein L6 [Candidatus Paceibacterota bacterium]|jgi:large subunit ribosomal protein L6
MSKIGKKPITIPTGVTLEFQGGHIVVIGPKGTLHVPKMNGVEITVSGQEALFQPVNEKVQTRMNWGTARSLLAGAIEGTTNGFSKTLEIEGIGFKANVEGSTLQLKVGFSHPVMFPIPADTTVTVEKNKIVVTGIDKQLVGQTAAKIRKIKKPEPYLGKGIRYAGEIVRRKAGKKAGAGK